MFRRRRGKIAPAIEIVCQEIIGLVGRDDVRVAGIDKGKRAPGRADIHGLPEAVQNQNLAVKLGLQVFLIYRFRPTLTGNPRKILPKLSSVVFKVNPEEEWAGTVAQAEIRWICTGHDSALRRATADLFVKIARRLQFVIRHGAGGVA